MNTVDDKAYNAQFWAIFGAKIQIEVGGVLPKTLRRGPYAVVERAERAKPPSSLVEII